MNGSVISFDISKDSCHYQAFIDFKKPIFKPKKLMWILDSFENLQKDIELLKEKSDKIRLNLFYRQLEFIRNL